MASSQQRGGGRLKRRKEIRFWIGCRSKREETREGPRCYNITEQEQARLDWTGHLRGRLEGDDLNTLLPQLLFAGILLLVQAAAGSVHAGHA